MKIEARLIKENEYITTEWSGGKTTELFIYPENTRYKDFNFKFRISSATVELEKSEFTKLPHIYRFITPLDNDLKLTHDNTDYINLKPYEIYEFQGDNHTSSFGKARDFNLMLRDGAKGQLQSICINREHSLTEEINGNIFYFIFPCDNDVVIQVNEENINIDKFETLLLKLSGQGILNIRICCNDDSNVLMGKVTI